MKRLNDLRHAWVNRQQGKLGYILAWALGVPVPILLVVYLVRGCN